MFYAHAWVRGTCFRSSTTGWFSCSRNAYYHIDSIFAQPFSRSIHALNVSEIACYIGFMCDWLSQEPTAIIYAPESFCVKRGTPIWPWFLIYPTSAELHLPTRIYLLHLNGRLSNSWAMTLHCEISFFPVSYAKSSSSQSKNELEGICLNFTWTDFDLKLHWAAPAKFHLSSLRIKRATQTHCC